MGNQIVMEYNREINKILAFEIRKERRLRDLTQQNMADELNMSQSKYNNLERNLMPICVDEWYSILKYFGLKLSTILIQKGL